ncbi:hypothetical protein GGI04_004128 [Coemansia thaxteri]|nr:hypothetical protein GGI04_004128 [Coemansia thaxteri]
MSAVGWLVTVALLAALAHVGGHSDRPLAAAAKKRKSASQQVCDGGCTVALRAVHLAFSIHRAFQAWVQNSLNQAELDVQELLQGDDTVELAEKRQHLADFLQSLPQRPEHFVAVLPEASIGSQTASAADAVEILCACALLAKVPRLTVYTRNGSLKSAFDDIAYRLRKSSMAQRAADSGKVPRICLDDGTHVECSGGDADACAGCERPPDLHISLWSRDNGYPALVRLARDLAAEAPPASCRPVNEPSVAARLADSAGHQHPDLLLLYDDLACLPDFPPWQLQNAEVFQIGSAARSLGDAMLCALASYAKIERRWGK